MASSGEHNPAEHYANQIAVIVQRFLHSMNESRSHIEVDWVKQDGFCITKLTLWKCQLCPEHLFLFQTVLYIRICKIC